MAGGLDETAAELCSGPLAEFVSARAKHAADADAETARRIRSLRKPSVAAWVVNVFARERAGQLAQALQLAADLRDAQEHLDAAALTELSRQRRALTRRLAEEAAELARTRGERITDATIEAVHQTISAAFFDPDAAAAVASGRLLRALEPGTGGSVDLEGGVAGSAPTPVVPAEPHTDELAERRKLRAAESALREAERKRERAERDLADATRRATEMASRTAHLAERVAQLEAELARGRELLVAAQADEANTREREGERGDAVRTAREAESAARAALERLGG